MWLQRFWIALAAIVAMSGIATTCHAEDAYPSRRVRVIVPFPAGSQTDLVARIVSAELSKKWRQTIYVDNLSGGSGNIGTSTAERAPPDGYTLLVVPPSFVVNPVVYKHVTTDASKWAAINVLVTVPYLLVARPSFPGNTTADLVTIARAKPNSITFASGGVGSSAYLSGVQLESMAGIKMVHVPFRGAAPALADVMAGQVDVVFDALATTFPLFKAGSVKVLGIGTRVRSPVIPTVPTIAEVGWPEYESTTWTAMVAPPNTPSAIVTKISAAVSEVLAQPEVVERLRSMHLEIGATTPAETAAFLQREANRWGGIARSAGISLD